MLVWQWKHSVPPCLLLALHLKRSIASLLMSKCKVCKGEFQKRSMTHKVCSPECAAQYAETERLRKQNRERRQQRERLKTRSQWLREAQAEFNKYIRLRDRDLPCISCGRYHDGAYDAGHYRSVGAAPQLRFDEDNCHKQCVPCNQFKAGNAIEYRIRLIERIGEERVGLLEGQQSSVKWTIDDAKRIKAEYREKCRQLMRGEL